MYCCMYVTYLYGVVPRPARKHVPVVLVPAERQHGVGVATRYGLALPCPAQNTNKNHCHHHHNTQKNNYYKSQICCLVQTPTNSPPPLHKSTRYRTENQTQKTKHTYTCQRRRGGARARPGVRVCTSGSTSLAGSWASVRERSVLKLQPVHKILITL